MHWARDGGWAEGREVGEEEVGQAEKVSGFVARLSPVKVLRSFLFV